MAGAESAFSLAVTLLFYLLMLSLVVFSIRKEKGHWLEKLGFKPVKIGKETLIAIGFALLLFSISLVVSIVFYMIDPADASKTAETVRQFGLGETLVIIAAAAFAEEIFFRGFLQRKTNLLFAAFIFAFFHIAYGSVAEVIGVFILGIVLGFEYQLRKSLYAPVISHFLYNLIAVILTFTFTQGAI